VEENGRERERERERKKEKRGKGRKERKKRVHCKMVGHPSSIEDTRDRDVLRKAGQKPIVRHTLQKYSTIATCHLPTPFQSHP